MEWKNYIESNREILNGKPVIKGTRISVQFILDLFSNGWTKEQILENYPNLTSETINAVFAFLAEVMQDEAIYILKKDAA
jgi:uncharacterized protein (DUF433 family)